ncbi:mannose-6-phosphate isomerase [Malacoplasma penetrans HF-2]|uniref:Mannose-6-phosphate isomerase n=2 Tax=Malacoplasma penetrans TaxID=28227 RepID=Q8EUZ7_MALP2|nr:mannose-6-phosphate isomerase [Malacoplasma penetrans HF-2]
MIMNNTLIFLKPYYDQKIWGGNKLKKFGYDIPSDKTGEAWLISALKDKSSIVINEEYKGMSFYDFFNNYRDTFFGSYTNEYPLLSKIIDANDNLSVQVHPDDEYAKNKHNKLGKTECWYILDCLKDSSIIYGHKALSVEEMSEIIAKDKWEETLIKIPVKPDDFYYVPSGTVHAINKGNLIFELQQSSDITYRLFDYHRKESDGKERELHIEDSLNVIKFPFEIPSGESVKKRNDFLVDNNLFKLKKIIVKDHQIISPQKFWMQGTVIEGNCIINGNECTIGTSFVSKSNTALEIKGKATLLLSWVD